MNDYEKQAFRSVISKYGKTNQIIVAIEEMSELIKALCKLLRWKPDYENIAEEMADDGIMLDQLSIMEQNADLVRKHRNEKVRRLKVRVMGRGCENDRANIMPR